jgi:hypothetical protein
MVSGIDQEKNQLNSSEVNRGLTDARTHTAQASAKHVPELGRARRPRSEERKRPLARRMGRRRGAVGYAYIAGDGRRGVRTSDRAGRQAVLSSNTKTYP